MDVLGTKSTSRLIQMQAMRKELFYYVGLRHKVANDKVIVSFFSG